MSSIYKTLQEYADDSHLEVIVYNRKCLKLRLSLDSEEGRIYTLLVTNPVHLDMPPDVMLGRVEFGDNSLLPSDYAVFRYRGYEGDEDSWRVMKVIDDEGNEYFVVFTEPEIIEAEELT